MGAWRLFSLKKVLMILDVNVPKKGQDQPGQREKFAFFQAAVYDAFVLMIIITI